VLVVVVKKSVVGAEVNSAGVVRWDSTTSVAVPAAARIPIAVPARIGPLYGQVAPG
jgi:hypothetical protein